MLIVKANRMLLCFLQRIHGGLKPRSRIFNDAIRDLRKGDTAEIIDEEMIYGQRHWTIKVHKNKKVMILDESEVTKIFKSSTDI